MINQEVLNYIRAQVQQGVSRDAIKKALATGGWSEQDMQEAFDAIDGVKKPPPPPPPPVQPQPRPQPQPQMQTPMSMGQSMARPQTVRPVPSMSTISSAPVQPRRKASAWPWVLLLLILILVCLGTAAYFFYPSLMAQYFPQEVNEEIVVPPATDTTNQSPVTNPNPFGPLEPEPNPSTTTTTDETPTSTP